MCMCMCVGAKMFTPVFVCMSIYSLKHRMYAGACGCLLIHLSGITVINASHLQIYLIKETEENTYTDRETGIHTERRQTDRQTDREAARQTVTDGQTDRLVDAIHLPELPEERMINRQTEISKQTNKHAVNIFHNCNS